MDTVYGLCVMDMVYGLCVMNMVYGLCVMNMVYGLCLCIMIMVCFIFYQLSMSIYKSDFMWISAFFQNRKKKQYQSLFYESFNTFSFFCVGGGEYIFEYIFEYGYVFVFEFVYAFVFVFGICICV